MTALHSMCLETNSSTRFQLQRAASSVRHHSPDATCSPGSTCLLLKEVLFLTLLSLLLHSNTGQRRGRGSL
jgi:hypothetical protein